MNICTHENCSNQAILKTQHNKKPLCKEHFLEYIYEGALDIIKSANLINLNDPKEKVLIAASGGKDSQVLLEIMGKGLKDKVHMEALHIEVGSGPDNYSKDSLPVIQDICDELGIKLHVISFKGILNFEMDDVHALGRKFIHKKRNKNEDDENALTRFRGECSYCGLFKRYLLNQFAHENGYTKVATGHNLTDEATVLFSNFLNADLDLMGRAGPITTTDVDKLVPRIKPLFYTYESEILLYAFYSEIPFLSTQCAYAVDSPMIRIKESLLNIEQFRQGTIKDMVDKYQNEGIKDLIFENRPEFSKNENMCKCCGMPSYVPVCSFCKTKEILEHNILK